MLYGKFDLRVVKLEQMPESIRKAEPEMSLVVRGNGWRESSSFDFDAWAAQARHNPDAYEESRRKIIEQVIATGCNPEQLKRVQWRVDAERRRAKTPYKACLIFSGMMWDMFADMQKSLSCFITSGDKRNSGPRLTLIDTDAISDRRVMLDAAIGSCNNKASRPLPEPLRRV